MYKLVRWPDSPTSEEGARRLEETIKVMEKLLDHEWLAQITGKDRVKIIDLCSGAGIASIALSRVLLSRGVTPEVVLVDLRRQALTEAVSHLEAMGVKAKPLCDDVLKAYRHGIKGDIVMLYGLSTPHFSPWSLAALLASTTLMVNDNGVLVVEEADRFYSTCIRGKGVEGVYLELASENSVVLNMMLDYNPWTGMMKRMLFDVISRRQATLEVHLYSLSETGALIWCFYRKVDFIPSRSRFQGLILAKEPRRIENPEEYLNYPILRGR